MLSSGNGLIKTRLHISHFLKIDEHFYPFPQIYFDQNVVFISQKKASAQCKFKRAMTLSFNFKGCQMIRMDNHQVHLEKIPTHVCLRFLTCMAPQNGKLFQSSWLGQFDWLPSVEKMELIVSL